MKSIYTMPGRRLFADLNRDIADPYREARLIDRLVATIGAVVLCVWAGNALFDAHQAELAAARAQGRGEAAAVCLAQPTKVRP